MRILQVSTRDLAGGAEQVAMNLHRGFRDRGHEAILAVGERRSDEPGTIEMDNSSLRGLAGRLERQASRGEARLPMQLARVVHAAGLAAQPRRLVERLLGHEDFEMPASRRILQRLPWLPDVVHCHNLHGGYFDLRELATLSARAPTFLTLHDMWSFTGHCAYSLGCERWRTGCGACPDLTIYPHINRDATRFNVERKRSIYRRSRLRIAAPSRWLLDHARASVLAEGACDWRLIPYGIDLTTFNASDRGAARNRLGIESGAPVLLFAVASHRNTFKDYATVAEAVRRIAERVRDERLVLLVVGAAGPVRTEGRTRFVPPVKDRAVLADHYRAADCFLHAAVEDNFPNTVLEAQACGTPVIATAVGGVPEQIEDGATGLLVPPKGAAEMADAVVSLLGDPARIERMQRRAAAVARERYDLERQIRDYCAWFDEVRADTSGRASSPGA